LLSKLRESEYHRVRPLFYDLSFNLVIDSVIDGNTSGWVYADNPVRPKTALLYNQRDALFISSQVSVKIENLDLQRTIQEEIMPDVRERSAPELAIQVYPKVWERAIGGIIGDLQMEKTLRRYYVFDRPILNWRNLVPGGYGLQAMERSLFENRDLSNLPAITAWILSFWPTLEQYLNRGFGYCLIRDDQVLSWCVSAYASGNDYELDLATFAGQQSQELGRLACAASIEHCAKNNLNPHWNCWNDDYLSIKIAESVGFENPVKYPVYRVKFRPDE